jgi:hypothetical protein
MTVLRCACGERIEGRGAALLEAVEAHIDAGHQLAPPPGPDLTRPDTSRFAVSQTTSFRLTRPEVGHDD